MEQNTIKSTVCARQEIQHVPQLSNMAALSKAMQRNFSDCISCLVNQHQTSDAQQANIAVNSMLLQLQRSHQRCRQKKAPEDLHVSSRWHVSQEVPRCPPVFAESFSDRFREETVRLVLFVIFNQHPAPFSALTPGL